MQESLTKILEENLRDVHLPEQVSWWPLAIGWWIIIALVILILGLVVYKLLQKKRRRQYRKIAQIELEGHYADWKQQRDTAQYLRSANSLLKRCVIHAQLTAENAPPIANAGTIGRDWGRLLLSLTPSPLSAQSLDALSIHCYQPTPKVDISSLHKELCIWLRKHDWRLLELNFDNGKPPEKKQKTTSLPQRSQSKEAANA